MPVLFSILLAGAIVWDYRRQRVATTRYERAWRSVRMGAVLVAGFSALGLLLQAMEYGPRGNLVYQRLFQLGPFHQDGWVESPLAYTRIVLYGLVLGSPLILVASAALRIPGLTARYTSEATERLRKAGVASRTPVA